MLRVPYVRKCSFTKMASRSWKENFMSLEIDVLLSEVHKGKSVILTVELRDLVKLRAWRTSAVNAVLPEGQTVTEIKKKRLDMKMASKKDKNTSLQQGEIKVKSPSQRWWKWQVLNHSFTPLLFVRVVLAWSRMSSHVQALSGVRLWVKRSIIGLPDVQLLYIREHQYTWRLFAFPA